MKGLHISFLIALILILFSIAAISLLILNASAFDWQNYPGLEKSYRGKPNAGVSGGGEPILSGSFDLGSTNDATRIVSESPNPYYASEIGCDIAKDIYNHFTDWGENKGDGVITHGSFVAANGLYCELDTKYVSFMGKPIHDDIGDYYNCLVSTGKFRIDEDMELTDQQSQKLYNVKCSNGCTYDQSGKHFELRLDEVCLNENLNVLMAPNPSPIPFCTNVNESYVFIGDERQKFGNRICSCNQNNNGKTSSEGWNWCAQSTCQNLCNAAGTRHDATPLNLTDFNRVSAWSSDDTSTDYKISDQALNYEKIDIFNKPDAYPYPYIVRNITSDNLRVLPQRDYFYTVYWTNDTKQYEIQFPRVGKPFYENNVGSMDGNQLINFVKGFYDEVKDGRSTTAGYYYPELRTVFDGIITPSQNITLGDIENDLENALKVPTSIDSYCSNEEECLSYDVNENEELWGEYYEQRGSSPYYDSPTLVVENENPLYIKFSSNINSEDTDILKSGKKYRIILRNWFSGHYRDYNFPGAGTWPNSGYLPPSLIGTFGVATPPTTTLNCTVVAGYWCVDMDAIDIGEKGRKMSCSSPSCPVGTEAGLSTDAISYKVNEYRYADKALIVIKLPDCSETDIGKDYYTYGENTISGMKKNDTCTGSFLNELYCAEDYTIQSETIVCSNGCENGACKIGSEFDFNISTNVKTGTTSQVGIYNFTINVNKVSTLEDDNVTLTTYSDDMKVVLSTSSGTPPFSSNAVVITKVLTPITENTIRIVGKSDNTNLKRETVFKLNVVDTWTDWQIRNDTVGFHDMLDGSTNNANVEAFYSKDCPSGTYPISCLTESDVFYKNPDDTDEIYSDDVLVSYSIYGSKCGVIVQDKDDDIWHWPGYNFEHKRKVGVVCSSIQPSIAWSGWGSSSSNPWTKNSFPNSCSGNIVSTISESNTTSATSGREDWYGEDVLLTISAYTIVGGWRGYTVSKDIDGSNEQQRRVGVVCLPSPSTSITTGSYQNVDSNLANFTSPDCPAGKLPIGCMTFYNSADSEYSDDGIVDMKIVDKHCEIHANDMGNTWPESVWQSRRVDVVCAG